MKIIFSRKGYDSSAGGFPSLIFPDGTLFSIPIPTTHDDDSFGDINFSYESDSIQKILNDLTGGRVCHNKQWKDIDYGSSKQKCHIDPAFISENGFTGIALGQVGSSEGHLRKQGVESGDLFLFYGWYKEVEKVDGIWRYKPSANDIHQMWAFMEVKNSVYLDDENQIDQALESFPFLKHHPHVRKSIEGKNRVYLSKSYQYFKFDQKRCLTDLKNYKGRATWRLPVCFYQHQAFSYLKEFTKQDHSTIVSYKGYGQEFVLDLDKVSELDRKSILDTVNNWRN